MLRGRLPWGLGRAVYLLVRSLVRACSFVRRCEVVDAFHWGLGDVIEAVYPCWITQVLNRRTSSCIVKGYHQ